jgi:hypothetical protein
MDEIAERILRTYATMGFTLRRTTLFALARAPRA